MTTMNLFLFNFNKEIWKSFRPLWYSSSQIY